MVLKSELCRRPKPVQRRGQQQWRQREPSRPVELQHRRSCLRRLLSGMLVSTPPLVQGMYICTFVCLLVYFIHITAPRSNVYAPVDMEFLLTLFVHIDRGIDTVNALVREGHKQEALRNTRSFNGLDRSAFEELVRDGGIGPLHTSSW